MRVEEKRKNKERGSKEEGNMNEGREMGEEGRRK